MRRKLPTLSVSLEFEPRDLWVGVFWRRKLDGGGTMELHIWLTIVPALPLHTTISWDVDLSKYRVDEKSADGFKKLPA